MGHYEWIIGKGIDKWVSLPPADYKSSCPSQYGRASKSLFSEWRNLGNWIVYFDWKKSWKTNLQDNKHQHMAIKTEKLEIL